MTDTLVNYNVVTAQSARAAAINTLIGSGGLVDFYTGSFPADPSVTATGTHLATGTCASPFGTVTNGVSGGAAAYLTAGAITVGNGLSTGTPGYMRISTSAGVGVIDLSCGATGSGAAVIVTPNTITSGAPVTISSCVITEA
jgi:hypothetical protein